MMLRFQRFFVFLSVLMRCIQSKSDTFEGLSKCYDEMNIETALTVAHVFQREAVAQLSNETYVNVPHRHFSSHPEAKMSEAVQMPLQLATEILFINHELGSGVINDLNNIPLSEYGYLDVMKACEKTKKTPNCDPFKIYRTYDGSCNNFLEPRWGSTFNCHQRYLPANYVGEGDFRQSVRGGPLPLPRTISIQVHSQINIPARDFNMLYVNFGQFLAHDITYTPETTQPNHSKLPCCHSKRKDSQCAPILISPQDPFYSRYNVTCMDLGRSALCATCKLGHRKQLSQVTAFIDGSQVYGSSEENAAELRSFDGTGKLRYERTMHGDMLPPSENPENDECSSRNNRNKICFHSGDGRCNQNPVLIGMHTLLFREHNNMATRLKVICPLWGEEKLYQEARRIVGAESQVIVYKEYLPITLGPEKMNEFHLSIDEDVVYNHTIDPTMWSEFSGAAFRFGHSLVNSKIAKNWPSESNEWKLRNYYFHPFYLQEGLIDSLFEKLVHTHAQSMDRYMQVDMSNYALKYDYESYGYDMASIDIQRGRDMGLPTYTQMVEFVTRGKIKIRSWDDLKRSGKLMTSSLAILRRTYRDPRDIDLWTGLMCEQPLQGAVVGEITAFIIADQFKGLKHGDRFYFDFEDQRGSFTLKQRDALKRVTMSGIVCSNTNATVITENAMLLHSDTNPLRPCSEIRRLDLSAWMDCS